MFWWIDVGGGRGGGRGRGFALGYVGLLRSWLGIDHKSRGTAQYFERVRTDKVDTHTRVLSFLFCVYALRSTVRGIIYVYIGC